MRLLVAVDLENEADRGVVAQAAAWAERVAGVVDLVYVDAFRLPVSIPEGAASRKDIDLASLKIETRRLAELRRWREALPPACRGEVHAPVGPVARVLADKAQGYDLLVVGTEGRQGLQRAWLGSVAEKIVRTSPIPVLVLRS